MNEEDEDSGTHVIHGLWNGLSLCRFTWEVPANWPNGNLWVPGLQVDEITCVRCKTEAEFLVLRGVGVGT